MVASKPTRENDAPRDSADVPGSGVITRSDPAQIVTSKSSNALPKTLPGDDDSRARFRKRLLIAVIVTGVLGGGWWIDSHREPPFPEGIAVGNGRIEAVQVDVATKLAGRLASVSVGEGDLVEKDQRLALLDTAELQTALARAQAQQAEAEQAVEYAQSNIAMRDSDLALAESELKRAEKLRASGAITSSKLDTIQNQRDVARATLDAAQASLRTQQFAVQAAAAQVEQLRIQLNDAELVSPCRGRVLYQLAESGEVVPAGGKVLTIIDLSDIYMEIYLPADEAAQTSIGSEARVVFDAAPHYTSHATVSFVSPQAQFTPKQVETREERDKLMFRVKVQLPPERVERYLERIKTGIRGVVYVKLVPDATWPTFLGPRFPEDPDHVELTP